MRILLTNDDGFDAQGLRLLERLAVELGDEIWTVAPEQEQSGASRALTLSLPVKVRQRGERRFSIAGTPTDCVRIAVLDLMESCKPDLIISGINRGQNVGEDLAHSGTIAAAIQGAGLGIRSMALSQAIGNYDSGYIADWSPCTTFGAGLITEALEQSALAMCVLNINFPACRSSEVVGIVVTRQGFHDRSCARVERRTDPRGDVYFWMCFDDEMPFLGEDTDVDALRARYVSITPLVMDLTDHGARAAAGNMTLSRLRERAARA
jgi:5'-nucleotidase